MVNEDAAVVEGDNLDAGGKAGLNFADFLLDGVDDFAGICAIADDDHPTDSFLAVLVKHTAAEFGAKLDARDIANGDWRAVVGTERDFFDILQSTDEADTAHNLFAVSCFHHFGADVVVASLDGR